MWQLQSPQQSSQEELFHTLTALTQDGRRVVFTADRAPTIWRKWIRDCAPIFSRDWSAA